MVYIFLNLSIKIYIISDTLLNVFLAIAVDNLANAQELTAAEEADEKTQEEVSECSSIGPQDMVNELFLFLPLFYHF